jgi:DNA polymerase I-like protein with 3'-5' exonuclease and polymerase domains
MSSPDSSKDLLRVFKACSIPITAWTEGGKPSFTGEVLRAIDHPVIKDVLEAAQLADLLSKYLTKYLHTVRSDGWLRYNLHQLRFGKDEEDGYGTVSGRFSSAGDDYGGINVQQVVSVKKQHDKKWCLKYLIRNLFKPVNGQWLAVDASQIEYRIFAHFAADPSILATYAPVAGMSVAEMMKAKVGPYTDYHDAVQAMLRTVKPDIKRKHTKITNFCKLFGSGIIKFAFTLETITEQQFKDLNAKYDINRWRDADRGEREAAMRKEPALQEALSVFDAYDNKFPSAKRTLNLAKLTAKDRGYVKTIMGRRARFPKKFKLHSALNRVVQGTAADINKRMLVEVYERRKELGLTLRMTVHDEVDADIADPGMMPRVEEVFNQQLVPLSVPILWDAEIGPSWGEAKGKA